MARRDDQHESLAGQAQDLWQLVVGYTKQETLDPIKGLGRFLAFGLAGALVGSVGLVLLLLGGLRLLQTETSAFEGRRTWIPYVLVVIVSAAIAGGALKGRSRGQRRDKA